MIFTVVAIMPATIAAMTHTLRRVLADLMAAMTQPRAAAVARYSIIDARLHTRANGEKEKTNSAVAATTGLAILRTRIHSIKAVTTKNARPTLRFATSAETPKAIGTLATAWKRELEWDGPRLTEDGDQRTEQIDPVSVGSTVWKAVCA